MANQKKYWLVNEAEFSDELSLDPPPAQDEVEEGGEGYDIGHNADPGHGAAQGQ